MSDGVPMQADGTDSPKVRSDGVSDVTDPARGGGGDSAGGNYDNPHSGKEAAGEAGGFDGGQSVKGYHGKGQIDGKPADPDASADVGQGGDTRV